MFQKKLKRHEARIDLITAVQKSLNSLRKQSEVFMGGKLGLRCTPDKRMMIHKRSLEWALLPTEPDLLLNCSVTKDYYTPVANAEEPDNHKCSAGKNCPLKKATHNLKLDLKFTLGLSSGIRLREFEQALKEPRE